MTIHVDKCKTFGIKKTVTRSVQFKPKLFLVREQVPTVDMDKSFKYLGRWYNFEMDNAEHKANIIKLTNDILMKIDSLPLHPRNKILLYSQYLHAKLSWDLTVADIDKTWIVNNIDNICRQFIRKWLEIPPSGTFDLTLLSREKFGFMSVQNYNSVKLRFANVSDPHRTSIFSSWPTWQMHKQSNMTDLEHQKKC